jgi:hypothetical protein
MKRWRGIWAFILIAGFLAPDVVIAMRTLAAHNPCGKLICCCPVMCKHAKKEDAHCHRTSDTRCGIKTATSQDAFLVSEHLPAPTFRIVSITTQSPPSSWMTQSATSFLFLPDAHDLSLDKPPATLS